MKLQNQNQVDSRVGRPRSEETRIAILSAARNIFETKGMGRLTIEAVAKHAGVGKPTIYRYWANAQELVMAALLEQAGPQKDISSSITPLDDLAKQLSRVITAFSTPRGRQMTLLLATTESDSELSKAFRNQIILRSREQGRALLLQAIERGECRRDIHINVALDMIYGPLFYRLLVGHASLDAKFGEEICQTMILGLK